MNTNAYEIPKYGEDVSLERVLLTADNIDSVSGFSGDADDIDFIEYLQEYAVNDNEARTYIYLNAETGETVAFVSLAGSAIIQKQGNAVTEMSPAILIDKFMVDKRYRHLQYSPDHEECTLSSMIFMDTLAYIEEITNTVLGAKYVVLYSTPEAYHFYRDKCEMEDFSEYMIRSDDGRTDFCIPMHCLI